MMMIGYGERSQHWNDQEVSDLITIWSQDDVQAVLDGTRRNSNAFSLISERLAMKGVHRSPAQVRDKIKTLKRDYRTVRTIADPQKRRTFRFYNQLDAVLNRRSSIHVNTNSSGITCSPRILSITSGEDAVSCAGDQEESLDCLDTMSSKDSEDGCEDNMAEPQVILDEQPSCTFSFQTKCEMPSPTPSNSATVDMNLMRDAETRHVSASAFSAGGSGGATSGQKGATASSKINHRDRDGNMNSMNCASASSSHGASQLESIVDRFVAAQKEIVSKFVGMEEARMKQECVLEEKRHAREMAMLERMMDYEQQRRREEREHEMKIFGMLSQFLRSLQGGRSAPVDNGHPAADHSQGPSSTSLVRGSKANDDPSMMDS